MLLFSGWSAANDWQKLSPLVKVPNFSPPLQLAYAAFVFFPHHFCWRLNLYSQLLEFVLAGVHLIPLNFQGWFEICVSELMACDDQQLLCVLLYFKNTLCLSMHQQLFKLQKGFLADITVVSASDGTPYWQKLGNCMRKWLVVGQNDKLQFWLALNNTFLKIKVPNWGFLQQCKGRTVFGFPKEPFSEHFLK